MHHGSDGHKCHPPHEASSVLCEHAFVSIKGSPYARFQRALQTRNLRIIETAALELETIQLDDALTILALMAEQADPRFDKAAARWVGRLLTETPCGLRDARFALAMVERLPECSQALHRLAGRRG